MRSCRTRPLTRLLFAHCDTRASGGSRRHRLAGRLSSVGLSAELAANRALSEGGLAEASRAIGRGLTSTPERTTRQHVGVLKNAKSLDHRRDQWLPVLHRSIG